MNQTRAVFHVRSGRGRPTRIDVGAGVLVVVLAALWVTLGGCSDERTEPLQPSEPAYTETIVLWQDAPTNGGELSKPFTVAGELAPIYRSGQDSPARLTVVAYIDPDNDIHRREQIVFDSIPYISNERMIPHLVGLDSVKRGLGTQTEKRVFDCLLNEEKAFWKLPDSLFPAFVCRPCDSLKRHFFNYDTTYCNSDSAARYPDSTVLAFDTTNFGEWYHRLSPGFTIYIDSLRQDIHDTIRLGDERDSLEAVLDNRYTLAIWLDQDTVWYPGAVYRDLSYQLMNQRIYAAATDGSGRKGRGFQLRLESFYCADPDSHHIGFAREIDYVRCSQDSTRPCLTDTVHTFHAIVTGQTSRITATLVLVYAEERP